MGISSNKSAMLFNSTTQISTFTNISSSFNALTDFLQVQIVVGGANLTIGTDILISLSTY